jgi:hypothetical protein
MHFKIRGKRDKIRFIPVHAMAQRLIEEYLALAGHGSDTGGQCSSCYEQSDERTLKATRRQYGPEE